MSRYELRWSDGGRSASGRRGLSDDCVVRAIAIASGRDYGLVYDELYEEARRLAASGRSRVARQLAARPDTQSPRHGVYRAVWEPYLRSLGWEWTPTMSIGSGCQVHARPDELPGGMLILRLSKHLVAVEDGVLFDTHDPTREGTRCVYGYWSRD